MKTTMRTKMNIYIDFDDCLCETAKTFSRLASEMFGKDVPYENMRDFNLQRAFSLTDEQYDQLLIRGHEPDVLLSFEETPGASSVINEWTNKGYEVSIITGRPYGSFDPSREWLDRHGLKNIRLYCLDKYGRENFLKNSVFSLKLEDFYKMKFDYAIEDSPLAFKFFNHLPELKVLVFDRPWNQNAQFPHAGYTRCGNWDMIKNLVK